MKPACERYQLDLVRYELRRPDGVKVKLERQPMELLIFLAGRTGRLVTRQEVAATLWPGGISVDSEPAINNAVRKIRAALHDSTDHPLHLETVVGKGYRFIGDLEVIDGRPPVENGPPAVAALVTTAPQRPKSRPPRIFLVLSAAAILIVVGLAGRALMRPRAGTADTQIRSLAVLPLQNLSGDPTQNFFADGITEELTTDLARISSLRVISRTSTTQYTDDRKPLPQIAKELRVDAVIEGSVLRSGNKVRITAQLIDARNDAHLWAQSYQRDVGDVLELQDSVAFDIASQVKASLRPEERVQFTSHRSVNPEAYESYLRGRNEIGKQTPDAMRKSIQFFQHAIDLDPFYAAGYAGLSDALAMLANYGVLLPNQTFPPAEAAARKALELDPSCGEAHASMAFAKHHFDWDWPGAEAEYRRALQLVPGLPMAHLRYAEFLSNAGRHEAALREINQARDLDPLSLTIANNVGRVLFYARRYDDAVQVLRAALSLHPDRAYARIHLGLAYEQKNSFPEAIAEFKRASQLMGDKSSVGLAHAYAVSGDVNAAKRMLRDLEKPSSTGTLDWFFIASVYAALGDKDQGFAWLEKACENRDFFVTYLNVYPPLDPLRSDPRFPRLLARVGIPAIKVEK